MDPNAPRSPGANYTSVDLNADATTTLYDGDVDALVTGVYLQNGGTSAVVQLEVTDGTDTAVLTPGQTAGDGIAYDDDIEINEGNDLQANVTTVEGAAQSNTAVVIRSEQ